MNKLSVLLMSGLLSVSLIYSSFIQGSKPLFFQENGNYVVNDNYIINKTTKMSDGDIKRLFELDKEFATRVKGKGFLYYGCFDNMIQRVSAVAKVDKFNALSRIKNLSRLTEVNQINQGCLDVRDLDWSQFLDLKKNIDEVLTKYNPALINGNIAINNNMIATNVTQIRSADMSKLSSMTIRGANEVDICGDYMGKRNFSMLINHSHLGQDFSKLGKVNVILKQYSKAK
jgi:hypothetical protein